MKSRAIILCALFTIAGLLLFTGCEPNVYNDVPGGNTFDNTTPRTPNHATPHRTTPHHTTHHYYGTPRHTTQHENNAVGERPPTAFAFYPMPLNTSGKIGWGLGRDTDGRNRPVDALVAQNKYGGLGAIFIDPDTDNKIYLTFDEGYENGLTPKILEALAASGVKATFFVTYDYCKSQPELIRRMIAKGHEVGNHSYSHPSFPEQSDGRVLEEIQKLHDYVKENFNYEIRLIRFPMGEFCERTLKIARDSGYRSVFWSFAYVDWQVDNQPAQEEAFAKITAGTHPGAVVLLHAVSETNAAILPDLLTHWLREGYKPSLFE